MTLTEACIYAITIMVALLLVDALGWITLG